MGIRKNGGRSCISMLWVWFCGERHKSVSAASMQQFTSLNQQRYVTAVVMFFFFQFWSNYATFDFRSSVVLFPPFCHVVKSSFGFAQSFQTQQMVTQHALCCRARDNESWEAVWRVPFDQRKFRKFEPVIFVEWKAPQIPRGNYQTDSSET